MTEQCASVSQNNRSDSSGHNITAPRHGWRSERSIFSPQEGQNEGCSEIAQASGEEWSTRKAWLPCGLIFEKIDLEDPTQLLDQVSLGCVRRADRIDEETTGTKTDIFSKSHNVKWRRSAQEEKRLTTLRKGSSWSHDVKGHLEN